MIYRLLLSFAITLVYGYLTSNPLYAQPTIVTDQPAEVSEEDQRPVPPLGPACSGEGGGLQIDPDNPTCCVSGYVYVNGAPARSAKIIIEAIDDDGIINTEQITTPVNGLNYLLHVGLDSLAISDVETVTVAIDTYTVIEQEGRTYRHTEPMELFENAVSESDEELIYRISPLELGDLDIHTNESVTIVTTYTVSSDSVQETRQYTTNIQIPDPSFNVTLHAPPLNVEPGDQVTMTVMLNDVEKVEVFTAHSGSIQVDVVMPDTRVNSSWVSNFLSAREDHAVVFDAANEQMVLFGGRDATGRVLNDIWVRGSQDDAQWVQMQTTVSPPPRSGHTLLYHDRYDVVLLFGGQNDEDVYFNDLWAWNGTKWDRLFIGEPMPSGRSHHNMAYDAKRREVVLFGGITGSEGNPELSDTWVLYGRNLERLSWLQLNLDTSPPKRLRHAMAYDSRDETIILFGGRSDANSTELLDDTWVWDGNGWEQKSSDRGGPVAREDHILTVNKTDQTLYLSGGKNNTEALDDSWAWDGSSWVQTEIVLQQPDAPQPDFIGWQGTAMAHEQDRQFLIFGGLAETLQAKSYRWHATGWQELTPQHRPPVRYHHTLVSGNAPEILLFGGIDAEDNYLNDTWLWNGQDWLQQNPLQSPQPRLHYAMAYDKEKSEWLLFGGMDQAGNLLNDLWVYTGTVWEKQTLANTPSARKGATLVYDFTQKATLLFGGQNDDQYFNDLWMWNNSKWTRQTSNGREPNARANHGAVYYDGTLKQMVISGGQGANGELRNTWGWDGSMWHEHHAKPMLPLNILSSLYYHSIPDQADQLVGMGTQSGDTSLGNMLLTYEITDEPISTISYLTPKDLYQHETLYLGGRGANTDESKPVAAHRWTLNGEPDPISTRAEFTITAEFSPGFHTIRYAVQDDAGNWSEEQVEEIYVRESKRIYFPTIMR